MPLPVLHSYAGYKIYKLSLEKGETKSWKMAGLFMLLANFADMDMIPGMLVGNPDLFHRSATHSIGAAVVCALVVAVLAKLIKKYSFLKFFLVSLNAYFSHVALDYITGSVRFMLWPFKISVKPLSFTAAFTQHHHVIPDFSGFGQFCQMLLSPSLTLRLAAECLLVYIFIKVSKFFSKSQALQPGISESPSLVAGLAIFIFVITALLATQAAI